MKYRTTNDILNYLNNGYHIIINNKSTKVIITNNIEQLKCSHFTAFNLIKNNFIKLKEVTYDGDIIHRHYYISEKGKEQLKEKITLQQHYLNNPI